MGCAVFSLVINRNTSHISAETCLLADKDDGDTKDSADKTASNKTRP
jgi:hypothetical protein